MKSTKAIKAMEWIIEKSTIRVIWLINDTYKLEERYFTGVLPVQMTNAIAAEIPGICSGKRFEFNGWKVWAESLNKFKGQPNKWKFSLNNEAEILQYVDDPENAKCEKIYENWK